MADGGDKTRNLRAEKQVEQLERELDLLKSRLKRTTNGSASPTVSRAEADKANFQLTEQVKDLKYQLKYQTSEYARLQENYTTKTGEYEEKLKRMREIFGQASKNIDGYRASIASKETELERLKIDLEECQEREQALKSLSETQQRTIEKLNTEVTSQKTFYGSEIKQLEAKSRQLSTQLEQTKTNYDQYKKRAHVLLEKNKGQKSDVTRINELEELVQQLQSQKNKIESEQTEKAERHLLLEHDIRKAVDRIHELETEQHVITKDRDTKQKALLQQQQASVSDKKSLESKLQTTMSSHQETLRQLEELKNKFNTQVELMTMSPKPTKEQDKDEMTQKYVDLKLQVHVLEEENESLYQQLSLKDNEIEKLIISTPTSPPIEESTIQPLDMDAKDDLEDDHDSNKNYNGNDVYASMSSLLSPLVSRQVPDERIGLEKQVQRLSELLHESEDKVTLLKNQEKILKDELRKIDAFEKRQDVNVEYLKNVLVKFLMSENKQAMVPILAKLLCLDTAETNTIMESCI